MKTIASILIALSVGILIVALVQKNSNYMSVSSVMKKHVSLFSKAPVQLCAIFIVPGLLAIAAVLSNAVSDTLMENLLVAVSIFFSVFFAVMSILCSMSIEGTETRSADQTKEAFHDYPPITGNEANGSISRLSSYSSLINISAEYK